ncbi:MAG: hypothetical protein ACYCSN_11610 [Acidobacteriaceae bacterium]
MLSMVVLAYAAACLPLAGAQERPYFVTYTHDLEEPGNLEIETPAIAGSPKYAGTFLSQTVALEYGATAWWTTEFYLSGQTTRHDSTIYNGFRWENRFRPLLSEHWINPVLYVEFEDVNAADKSLLEVVGHDGIADFATPNYESRLEKQHEMELKLILSRNWRGWNFSENTIFEKNLNNSPWEFGYAWGATRPLGLVASGGACWFCREKWQAGMEMYGGLGDRYSPGLHDTSHYVSPIIAWNTPRGTTFSFGPAIGLSSSSAGILYRFRMNYELDQIFRRVGNSEQGGAR